MFVHLTHNWVELAARFVVPVRTARSAKDEISRHALERLAAAGIEVASTTATVTLRGEPGGPVGEDGDARGGPPAATPGPS